MADDVGEINRKMGEGTRVAVSNEELVASGWEVTKLSKGFRYVSPDGKLFWSSKEVAKFVTTSKTSAEMFEGAGSDKTVKRLPLPPSSESESDSDFHPSEVATSDDAFSSPEKRVAISYNMKKR